MWEPSKDSYIYAIWLRKFTILILKSNQLVIAIAGAVVNVNAIRIISNTLPQFGEMRDNTQIPSITLTWVSICQHNSQKV